MVDMVEMVDTIEVIADCQATKFVDLSHDTCDVVLAIHCSSMAEPSISAYERQAGARFSEHILQRVWCTIVPVRGSSWLPLDLFFSNFSCETGRLREHHQQIVGA